MSEPAPPGGSLAERTPVTADLFTLCQKHVFKVLSYMNRPVDGIKISRYSGRILITTDWELDPNLLQQLRTRYGVKEVSESLPRFYYEIRIPGCA